MDKLQEKNFTNFRKELDPEPDLDPLVRGPDPRCGSAPKCHGSPTLKESKVNISPLLREREEPVV